MGSTCGTPPAPKAYGFRPPSVDFADVKAGFEVTATEKNWDQPFVQAWDFTESQGKRQEPSKGTAIAQTEKRGISLQQLRAAYLHILKYCKAEEWCNREGMELAPDKVTLYDLCAYLIKPSTEKNRCSYVELVAGGEQVPTWMVSHWWGEPVKDFIACLERHRYDRKLDVGVLLYWVCAYANNQWELGGDVTLDPAQSSFRKAIDLASKGGGGVVSVVDRSGIYFSRIWCNYEVSSSLMNNVKYDMYTACDHVFENGEKFHGNPNRMAVGIAQGAAGDGNYDTIAQRRQAYFPTETLAIALAVRLEAGTASVESDRVHILNSITGSTGKDLEKPPKEDPQYDKLNDILRTYVALNTIRSGVKGGGEVLKQYTDQIKKSGAEKLTICLWQEDAVVKAMNDDVVKALVSSLPPTLKHLQFGCVKNTATGWALKQLPDLSHLELLETLNLQANIELETLSDLSAFQNLSELRLDRCPKLKALPDSLTKLPKLEKLNIAENTFAELPKKIIMGLPALKVLAIGRMKAARPRWLKELEKKGIRVVGDVVEDA